MVARKDDKPRHKVHVVRMDASKAAIETFRRLVESLPGGSAPPIVVVERAPAAGASVNGAPIRIDTLDGVCGDLAARSEPEALLRVAIEEQAALHEEVIALQAELGASRRTVRALTW